MRDNFIYEIMPFVLLFSKKKESYSQFFFGFFGTQSITRLQASCRWRIWQYCLQFGRLTTTLYNYSIEQAYAFLFPEIMRTNNIYIWSSFHL